MHLYENPKMFYKQSTWMAANGRTSCLARLLYA